VLVRERILLLFKHCQLSFSKSAEEEAAAAAAAAFLGIFSLQNLEECLPPV